MRWNLFFSSTSIKSLDIFKKKKNHKLQCHVAEKQKRPCPTCPLFSPYCGFSNSLFHLTTVALSGQPLHAGARHHGNTGTMREKRAAGDPYWSYSGELLFVRWLEPSGEDFQTHFFDLLTSALSCLLFSCFSDIYPGMFKDQFMWIYCKNRCITHTLSMFFFLFI